jgi:MYXO-CTERM domain-containing protein
VDLSAFDTKVPYTITYVNPDSVERHKPEGAGAAGVAGVLAAVLGAAFVARRREA